MTIWRGRQSAVWKAVRFLIALALLAKGGSLVNAPSSMGGPGAFDLASPAGVLCLLAGTALLSASTAPHRTMFIVAAFVTAVPAAWNFWRYPPLLDGAGYALYLGLPDPDTAPAAPAWTVVGLAFAVFFLAAGHRIEARWRALAIAGPATLVACWAFAGFDGQGWPYDTLERTRWIAIVACGGLVILGIVYRRTIAPPVIGGYAALLLALFAATRWIEIAVLNRASGG